MHACVALLRPRGGALVDQSIATLLPDGAVMAGTRGAVGFPVDSTS